MRAKYVGATIFVDHHTDFTYVHLMRDFSVEATVEAKNAFERMANSYGVTIKAYHADNGRYSDPLFLKDVDECGQ